MKKADTPGELMSVSEFLRAVRRIVVDFVVGRVLSEAEAGGRGDAETRGRGDTVSQADWSLDDVTTYYLLHRHDFGMDDAPAGACILYAVSCNLSEAELADKYDVLVRSGGEAELLPNQIQDLAEVMGDLLKVRGGCDLKFNLRIEFSGKPTPDNEVVDAVNEVLDKVSRSLKVK